MLLLLLRQVDSYSVREAILRGSHSRSPALKALKDKDVLFDRDNPDKLTVLPPELKDTGTSARAASAVAPGRRQYFVIQVGTEDHLEPTTINKQTDRPSDRLRGVCRVWLPA